MDIRVPQRLKLVASVACEGPGLYLVADGHDFAAWGGGEEGDEVATDFDRAVEHSGGPPVHPLELQGGREALLWTEPTEVVCLALSPSRDEVLLVPDGTDFEAVLEEARGVEPAIPLSLITGRLVVAWAAACGTDLDELENAPRADVPQELRDEGFIGETDCLDGDNLVVLGVRPGRWLAACGKMAHGDGDMAVTWLRLVHVG